MKLKYIAFLLFIFLGFSCHDDHEELATEAKRTVLVYMLANNSLASYGTTNIKDMIAGASAQNLNGGHLVLFYDMPNENPRLIEIVETKDNLSDYDTYTSYLKEHTIKTYTDDNSADPDVMLKAIQDVKTQFSAEEYGLILWSHGTAWIPSNINSMLKAFGQDGYNWLEVDELAKGIPDNVFKFIMFDACYMASIECVYELKNKAEYILASPTETMATGWPYKTIIPYFFQQTAQLEKIAEIFFDTYNKQSGDYRTATVSVTKTSELDNLAVIVKEILANKSESDIYGVDRSSQSMQRLEYLSKSGSYNPVLLFDFNDFIKQLATAEQYSRFTACMDKLITYEAHTPMAYFGNPNNSYPINRCCGLSAYVPLEKYPQVSAWYQERLKWYKAVYK
jgi:Clostripain family